MTPFPPSTMRRHALAARLWGRECQSSMEMVGGWPWEEIGFHPSVSLLAYCVAASEPSARVHPFFLARPMNEKDASGAPRVYTLSLGHAARLGDVYLTTRGARDAEGLASYVHPEGKIRPASLHLEADILDIKEPVAPGDAVCFFKKSFVDKMEERYRYWLFEADAHALMRKTCAATALPGVQRL